MWVEVCSFDELEHGRIRVVDVPGLPVGVIRWGDEVHALRMTCTHQMASLANGVVRPRLTCDSLMSAVEADPTSPVVTCPWHQWEFDVRTGRPTWNPSLPGLRTYPVGIVDGLVQVDLPVKLESKVQA
ncbi:Rieske (2Fe-2S) protein [Pseudonocardia sp. GCM10023141]|uniref:Rieske (2Fe-2S) protein n=1 Tax=Pseudonocardia sp. GCM10023141 TaxID=3252653 RepID=UPI003622B78F